MMNVRMVNATFEDPTINSQGIVTKRIQVSEYRLYFEEAKQ